ncbi:nuclear transport factor 2 family protein [Novosphingobium sp.]|uniref:nuclear transport factor 2 family protein n=1 Tax=Novosphingobium sp. TaxID=1874826 RepID=UPI0038B7A924
MSELEILDRRLRQLEDREAIRELIASYGPLADAGMANELAALWTEDGIYEIVGFSKAVGHAEIAGLIDGPVHQALMADGCAHLLGPVSIALHGDEAEARGHSVVLRHDGEGFAAHRVSANRWSLRRTPQGWRVTHRANALLDGTEAARLLLGRAS